MMTDPIADMLTRIRNANQQKLATVDVPHSNLKAQIARILASEGYVAGFEVVATDGPQDTIRIQLKYGPRQERAISHLERISKPGRRIYMPRKRLPRVLSGLGVAIVSTSRGVMTDREARREGVGGEVLCTVY
ncbi:MAG TPA: 30S ribosomal protein S8 [Armatimonadetes bacterium]|nr:30S ribosomal protein S8 [Armatimonadota bacterium]